MKFLVLLALLVSTSAQADILLGLTGKYGISGYDVSGGGSSSSSSSSSVIKRGRCFRRSSTTVTSTTTSSSPLDIDDVYEFVPGIMLQTVPEKKYDFSVGIAGYLDETVSVFFGIRL